MNRKESSWSRFCQIGEGEILLFWVTPNSYIFEKINYFFLCPSIEFSIACYCFGNFYNIFLWMPPKLLHHVSLYLALR